MKAGPFLFWENCWVGKLWNNYTDCSGLHFKENCNLNLTYRIFWENTRVSWFETTKYSIWFWQQWYYLKERENVQVPWQKKLSFIFLSKVTSSRRHFCNLCLTWTSGKKAIVQTPGCPFCSICTAPGAVVYTSIDTRDTGESVYSVINCCHLCSQNIKYILPSGIQIQPFLSGLQL